MIMGLTVFVSIWGLDSIVRYKIDFLINEAIEQFKNDINVLFAL